MPRCSERLVALASVLLIFSAQATLTLSDSRSLVSASKICADSSIEGVGREIRAAGSVEETLARAIRRLGGHELGGHNQSENAPRRDSDDGGSREEMRSASGSSTNTASRSARSGGGAANGTVGRARPARLSRPPVSVFRAQSGGGVAGLVGVPPSEGSAAPSFGVETASFFRFRFDAMPRAERLLPSGRDQVSLNSGSHGRSSRATRWVTAPPKDMSTVADAVFRCAAGGDMSQCSRYKVRSISMCSHGNQAPGCSMFSTALVPPQGAYPMSLLDKKNSPRGLRQLPRHHGIAETAGVTAGVTVDRGAGDARGAPSQLQLLGKHTIQGKPQISGRAANSVGASIASGMPISRVPATIKLDPPRLVTQPQPLCQPSVSQVAIQNTGTKPLTMYSTTTESSDFHPALFDDGRRNRRQHAASEFVQIEPGATMMMSIVFLPREVGVTNATLIVQTNLGGFLYEVSGTGVPSPFGLEPMDAGRLPLGAKYSTLMRMWNPLPEFIQVTEMFSSTGFVSIGVPRARGHPKTHDDVWTVAPHKRQTVADVLFYAAETGKYEDFVHVAALFRREVNDSWKSIGFVVPFSATVVGTGVHSSVDVFNFGTITEPNENRTLPIELLNVGATAVRFKGAVVEQHSPAPISIDFVRSTVPPHSSTLVVGTLTFNGMHEGEFFGFVVIRTNASGVSTLSIPYRARVMHGSLEYPSRSVAFPLVAEHDQAGALYKSVVQKIMLRNTFHVPITIFRAEIDERYSTELLAGACFPDAAAITGNLALAAPHPEEQPPRGEFRAHVGGSGLPSQISEGNVSTVPIIVSFLPRATERLPNGIQYARLLKVFTNEAILAIPLCVFDGEFGVLVHDETPVVRKLSEYQEAGDAVDFGVVLVGETNVRFVSVFNSFPVPLYVTSARVELGDADWIDAEVFPVSVDANHSSVLDSPSRVKWDGDGISLRPGCQARFAVRVRASHPRDACFSEDECPTVVFESSMPVSKWTQRRTTVAPLRFSAEEPSIDLMIGRWHSNASVASELSETVFYGSPVISKVFVRNTFPDSVPAKSLSVADAETGSGAADAGFATLLEQTKIEGRSDAMQVGWVMAAIKERAEFDPNSFSLSEFLDEFQVALLEQREALWRERVSRQPNVTGVVTLFTGPGANGPGRTLRRSVVASLGKPQFAQSELSFGFVARGGQSFLPIEVFNPTATPVRVRLALGLTAEEANKSMITFKTVQEPPVASAGGGWSLWNWIFGSSEEPREPTSDVSPFELELELELERGDSEIQVDSGSRATLGTLRFAPGGSLPPAVTVELFVRNNVTVSEKIRVVAHSARTPIALVGVDDGRVRDELALVNCSGGNTFSLARFSGEPLTISSVHLVSTADIASCRARVDDHSIESCLKALAKQHQTRSCLSGNDKKAASTTTVTLNGLSLSCDFADGQLARGPGRVISGVRVDAVDSHAGNGAHRGSTVTVAASSCTDAASLLFVTTRGIFDVPMGKDASRADSSSESSTDTSWTRPALFVLMALIIGVCIALFWTGRAGERREHEIESPDVDPPLRVSPVVPKEHADTSRSKHPKGRGSVSSSSSSSARRADENSSDGAAKGKKPADPTKLEASPGPKGGASSSPAAATAAANEKIPSARQSSPKTASSPVAAAEDEDGDWQEPRRRSTKPRAHSREDARAPPVAQNGQQGSGPASPSLEPAAIKRPQSGSSSSAAVLLPKKAVRAPAEASAPRSSGSAAAVPNGTSVREERPSVAAKSKPKQSASQQTLPKSSDAGASGRNGKKRPVAQPQAQTQGAVTRKDAPKPPRSPSKPTASPKMILTRPRRASLDSPAHSPGTSPGTSSSSAASDFKVGSPTQQVSAGGSPVLDGSVESGFDDVDAALNRSVSVDQLATQQAEVPLWDPWSNNGADLTGGGNADVAVDPWATLQDINPALEPVLESVVPEPVNSVVADPVTAGEFDFFTYNPSSVDVGTGFAGDPLTTPAFDGPLPPVSDADPGFTLLDAPAFVPTGPQFSPLSPSQQPGYPGQPPAAAPGQPPMGPLDGQMNGQMREGSSDLPLDLFAYDPYAWDDSNRG
jgi:Transmembrane protein 131-like N-terminal